MQGDAIQAILDSDDHIILAGATASGKTEAAFLPILSKLEQQPSKSVAVLYLGPLKALINDQFQRLDHLLEHADIPVTPWHGDSSAGRKNRLLKNPQGILQTTPESMEGFFLYRQQYLHTLFQDLRYVVIDEVHAFMASDRGRQVLCQLQRLERNLNIKPRRIGLSATLGDYQLAKDWLAKGQKVRVIDDRNSKRTIHLALSHYQLAAPSFAEQEPTEAAAESEEEIRAHLSQSVAWQYYKHLFELTQQRKSLIFVNSRNDAERISNTLRLIAQQEKQPDIYFVHHGSVSKDYRHEAESAMREAGRPACTIATLTLELGIDLGQLERVIQIGHSPSVSSFVQRLGRTGRRGEAGEMFFFSLAKAPDHKKHPLQQLPWELLISIAQIQLYLEERWVEAVPAPQYPLSLLYHQTMSILREKTELNPAHLAQEVLTLAPFRQLSQEDFKLFLRHLIAADQLELTEKSTLIIGYSAEPIVNHWNFLATFQDDNGYRVLAGKEVIGSLATAPSPNSLISLLGRSWRVKEVNLKKRIVLVERSQGSAKTMWLGSGYAIHTRVMQRVKQILQENTIYAYLQDSAKTVLKEARGLMQAVEILDKPLHLHSDGSLWLMPWLGTPAYHALNLMLSIRLGDALVTGRFIHSLQVSCSLEHFQKGMAEPVSAEELMKKLPRNTLAYYGNRDKFNRFVPKDLLKKGFVYDGLDVKEAQEWLLELQKFIAKES